MPRLCALLALLVAACGARQPHPQVEPVACRPQSRGAEFPGWRKSDRLDTTPVRYPSAAYSPQGDLFVFYAVPSTPEQLKLRIRRHDAATFGAEIAVAPNGRTAHPLFRDDRIHVAIENSGTALVYTSTDNGESWNWEVSFQARDGSAEPAWDSAYLVADGANLALFYGYAAFNSVVGVTKLQGYSAIQIGGAWPGAPNAVVPDVLSQWGMQGAFTDGQGTFLVASTRLLWSSDHGRTFEPVWTDLVSPVVASTQSGTDRAVLLASYGREGGPIALWKTDDLGTTLQRAGELRPTKPVRHVELGSSGRYAYASYADEDTTWLVESTDGGCTWQSARDSGPGTIVFAAAADGRLARVTWSEAAGIEVWEPTSN